jgi:hypothetical protein
VCVGSSLDVGACDLGFLSRWFLKVRSLPFQLSPILGLIARGLIARGLIARGLIAHGLIAHGLIALGRIARGLAGSLPAANCLPSCEATKRSMATLSLV